MGPTDNELKRLAAELREFEGSHKDVIIKRPTETPSGLWELSLPESACTAFDSLRGMLQCLRMTTFGDDPEDPDE